MTITTGSGEVKSRWIRLNGKMVTEKEYNAYMNREKALVKKKRADERKALAKAKAKAKAEERKALAKAKAKAKKSKAKVKSKVKTVVPYTKVVIGPTNPDALMATPRAKTPKAKAKVKTPTAKKRIARPKSQGVMTERYYIIADVNGTGRNMRYFNVASGRAVENQRNATYGITPEEANSIIMTARTVYPGMRFSVKKRRA